MAPERNEQADPALAAELRQLFALEPVQASADTIATKLGRRVRDVRKALRSMVASGELTVGRTTSDRRYRRRTEDPNGTEAWPSVHEQEKAS
jgi:hypothetical protein